MNLMIKKIFISLAALTFVSLSCVSAFAQTDQKQDFIVSAGYFYPADTAMSQGMTLSIEKGFPSFVDFEFTGSFGKASYLDYSILSAKVKKEVKLLDYNDISLSLNGSVGYYYGQAYGVATIGGNPYYSATKGSNAGVSTGLRLEKSFSDMLLFFQINRDFVNANASTLTTTGSSANITQFVWDMGGVNILFGVNIVF